MKRFIKRIKYQFRRGNIGKILKYLISPLFGYPIYLFSFIVPRKKSLWIFGSHSKFNGNSKYLFIYVNETQKDITPVWICSDKKTLHQVRQYGYKAYMKWSLKGLIYSLRGAWYIYSRYTTDINFWTTGRAKEFNLWHGIGLKRIGFNIKKSMSALSFNEKNIFNRIFLPYIFRRPTYLLSTSPFITEYLFVNAFRITKEQCVELGYPRNDMFFLNDNDYYDFVKKYGDKPTLELIPSFKKYDKVFLYVPTWRETRKSFIKDAFPDIKKLDKLLEEKNYLFIMKFHIETKTEEIVKQKLKNIVVLDSFIDVYTLFKDIDVLVTDYSSIYYDYILLNKEVLLYPFDKDEYINEGNGLIADYDEYTQGVRANNFTELCEIIEKDIDLKIPKYDWIRETFWANYDGNASKNITEFIKNV